MPSSRAGIVLAGFLLCCAQPASAGVVTITMIENAGSIAVTLSGSLDYTSAGSPVNASFSNFIGPANGTIGFGTSPVPTLQWTVAHPTYPMAVQSAVPGAAGGGSTSPWFSPFGTGAFANGVMTGVSGSTFFVYTSGLAVDASYTSGSALSATGTIAGSFATHGITVGTSTTQFTLGASGGSANTLIVNRSVASVPDQMPTAVVGAGVVLLGLAARRRRR